MINYFINQSKFNNYLIFFMMGIGDWSIFDKVFLLRYINYKIIFIYIINLNT